MLGKETEKCVCDSWMFPIGWHWCLLSEFPQLSKVSLVCFVFIYWCYFQGKLRLEWVRAAFANLPSWSAWKHWIVTARLCTCSGKTQMRILTSQRKGFCCVWWVLSWTLGRKCSCIMKTAPSFSTDSWIRDLKPSLNQTITFARVYHQPGKKPTTTI